jgi:hypothetical protein
MENAVTVDMTREGNLEPEVFRVVHDSDKCREDVNGCVPIHQMPCLFISTFINLLAILHYSKWNIKLPVFLSNSVLLFL